MILDNDIIDITLDKKSCPINPDSLPSSGYNKSTVLYQSKISQQKGGSVYLYVSQLNFEIFTGEWVQGILKKLNLQIYNNRIGMFYMNTLCSILATIHQRIFTRILDFNLPFQLIVK